MSHLSERMQMLMRRKNLSNADLAKAAGIKPSSVSAWLDGKSKGLKAETALQLSKSLNISLTWLVTGKGDPDLHEIEIYNSSKLNNEAVFIEPFSLVNESSCDDIHPEENQMIISNKLIEQLKINPQNCRSFLVTDNTMSPLMYEGYEVLVNLDDSLPKNDKIYLIDVNGTKTIRRVTPLLKGGLILKDEHGKEEIFEKDEVGSLKIIGRVIYLSGYSSLL